MEEEWQRHNNVLLLSGLFLAEVLNSSLNCMLSLWCHMMDFLGCFLQFAAFKKKKKKSQCQFSGQQAAVPIRKLLFSYPTSSYAFWLLKKSISIPARTHFLCCTTPSMFLSSWVPEYVWCWFRCGRECVCVCTRKHFIIILKIMQALNQSCSHNINSGNLWSWGAWPSNFFLPHFMFVGGGGKGINPWTVFHFKVEVNRYFFVEDLYSRQGSTACC